MNGLSKEQLSDLTARVNTRLAEFGGMFENAIPGVVRLTYDAIQEWTQEQATDDWCELEESAHVEVEIAPPPAAQSAPFTVAGVADDPTRYTNPSQTYTNGNHVELSASTVATLGPEHTVVTSLKGRGGNVLPDKQMLVAEVKRLSMGGMMPTMAAFDDARPATWATAQAHLIRLGLTWETLADEAGLKLKPRGVKSE